MANAARIPFHFHAEGHALSGVFHRPISHLIEAQAATSLPTIGGHARSHVEDFNAQNLVKFKLGHTHVSGSWQDDEVVTTHATTTVEHLNILDVVTADRIVCRLTSEHRRGEMEGHIIAVGSRFENLRIAGEEVNVTLRHDLFLKCENFEQLRNKVATDKDSGKIAITQNGYALCSLVEKIETDLPGVDSRRHTFKVPHFGVISLAEVFAEPGTRTLTMIRLALGSPHAADLTVAEDRTNGQPMPPANPPDSGGN
jgi:hypothetical protein